MARTLTLASLQFPRISCAAGRNAPPPGLGGQPSGEPACTIPALLPLRVSYLGSNASLTQIDDDYELNIKTKGKGLSDQEASLSLCEICFAWGFPRHTDNARVTLHVNSLGNVKVPPVSGCIGV